MKKYLERLAIRFLEDQGFCVLPRTFIGVAIGYGIASGSRYDMRVVFPEAAPSIIAMNQSVIDLELATDAAPRAAGAIH